MFLVEKDSTIEPKLTLINNATNLVAAGSIAGLIDADRHKFDTFADALWWGIVCNNYFIFLIYFFNVFIDYIMYSKKFFI
jgi:hypothetical protein